ncbi:MAG TPA: hypothetical protein VFT22_27735 [Kofleriaceae bacterium]|nr:hypothetical protein [Kofleriaceae bacterium]
MRPRNVSAVTAEMVTAMNQVHAARDLASRLREAKSAHAWTIEECDLLARLCIVLGVKEGP